MWTTSAHFADGTVARARIGRSEHKGISVFLLRWITRPHVTEIRTMATTAPTSVFDNVRVSGDYLVVERTRADLRLRGAHYERFTMFTVGPIRVKFDALLELLASRA